MIPANLYLTPVEAILESRLVGFKIGCGANVIGFKATKVASFHMLTYPLSNEAFDDLRFT